MTVYTVHEPPLRARESVPDPDRFIFVRDGFSVWAFVFSALWMLWHRMWRVLLIYIVVVAGIEAGLRALGVSAFVQGIVGVLIAVVVGIEAGTLRRFELTQRGYKHIGVVSGEDLEDAERRFFDAWVRAVAGKRPAPPAASASPPSAPPSPLPPPPASPPKPADVVGLFPEPGASP